MFSITPYKEIQDSLGFWIPRCGFRIPGTGFQFLSVELEFWIPIVSGIPDSLSCIPDSKAQDSRFHQQKFPDSEILIPLHGAISIFFHYCLFSLLHLRFFTVLRLAILMILSLSYRTHVTNYAVTIMVYY